jgi:hypothetical protein
MTSAECWVSIVMRLSMVIILELNGFLNQWMPGGFNKVFQTACLFVQVNIDHGNMVFWPVVFLEPGSF